MVTYILLLRISESVSPEHRDDGQERSRDSAHHYTRNALCNLLRAVFYLNNSDEICKNMIINPDRLNVTLI